MGYPAYEREDTHSKVPISLLLFNNFHFITRKFNKGISCGYNQNSMEKNTSV